MKDLINHIEKSIDLANQEKSKLPKAAFDVPGFTSPKIRHLLNNLGDYPGFKYLEIGVHKGGTFVASNINNKFDSSIAVDNWSEFSDGPDGTVRQEFVRWCKNLLHNNCTIYEQDCFTLTPDQIKDINFYLYDGCHSYEAQAKSLTYFYPMLADTFIFLVDDFDWDDPKRGTHDAIKSLDLEVLFEKELIGKDGWWNGFFVSLLRKKQNA